MRRLARHLFTLCAAASLLLCIGLIVFVSTREGMPLALGSPATWYSRHATRRLALGSPGVWHYELDSARGRLMLWRVSPRAPQRPPATLPAAGSPWMVT